MLHNLRPLQSIYQVLSGEVHCALIDDAQLAELQHLDGAGEVRHGVCPEDLSCAILRP